MQALLVKGAPVSASWPAPLSPCLSTNPATHPCTLTFLAFFVCSISPSGLLGRRLGSFSQCTPTHPAPLTLSFLAFLVCPVFSSGLLGCLLGSFSQCTPLTHPRHGEKERAPIRLFVCATSCPKGKDHSRLIHPNSQCTDSRGAVSLIPSTGQGCDIPEGRLRNVPAEFMHALGLNHTV